MPLVPPSVLRDFAGRLLRAAGANAEEAQTVAESLVGANLRGLDSHGVMRLTQYVDSINRGEMTPGATLTILRETPAMLACDGNGGFGMVLGRDLTARLIDKARTVGVGCGTLRAAGHLGRMGEYAEQAATAGMAALIFANIHGSPPRVAPPGGTQARLGTNPLCLGFPDGEQGPFVLDFGTSATAEGKVRVAKLAGKQVPPGWLLDAQGNPTTDPNTLYADPPGTILPMGGDQAYRGFGLALLIDLFCTGLSGAAAADGPPMPRGNAAVFVLISPEHAAGFEHVRHTARRLEAEMRTVPRRASVESIMLPGDPERQTAATRSQTGIELDAGNWAALTKLAATLSVAVPALSD